MKMRQQGKPTQRLEIKWLSYVGGTVMLAGMAAMLWILTVDEGSDIQRGKTPGTALSYEKQDVARQFEISAQTNAGRYLPDLQAQWESLQTHEKPSSRNAGRFDRIQQRISLLKQMEDLELKLKLHKHDGRLDTIAYQAKIAQIQRSYEQIPID
ncbi:hypothetical protein [Pontibacter sp. G13]|uniref:hypothetical protein n=1 Tax=Pontibacter sp. G13 TaxID=3074898 RepID=UPI00288ADE42|nr:hypothetical protein [Pontibacter sp. G13]WNJ17378.1 hypothetical protein RJD25_21215 [Pontibacter sp. G13]